ncbi:alpha-ketoglutarate-dependent dioxygenase AlkB [Lysobacter korlensis]|uniref:Alpha-ketoglutarate-dependent dioxygenase AlkB n=1 Tax=Lysobacter korlensis TaxID=553636 RepID=A0ABV6RVH6_9GAMM
MSLAFQASLFDSPEAEPTLGSLDGLRRIPLAAGAWLDVLPGWVSDSDGLFEQLVQTVPWRADRREMYDRVVDVPRLVCSYRDGDPLPDATLQSARDALNTHYAPDWAEAFATAGLCFYRNGGDSVAWHGDYVARDRLQDTSIAILSLGAPRMLAVRPKGGGEALRFPLGHGDLLVMGGSCQRTHEHAVLKTKKAVGPRVSVQFRPSYARSETGARNSPSSSRTQTSPVVRFSSRVENR